MTVYDVCIIGGGASGLIAAISAKRARQDISILVIEKNDRVGKKLINTGNGRCNITNADISAGHYYSSDKAFFAFSKNRYRNFCVANIYQKVFCVKHFYNSPYYSKII